MTTKKLQIKKRIVSKCKADDLFAENKNARQQSPRSLITVTLPTTSFSMMLPVE
ncbi:hypothetical protein HNQ91_000515 [Filimonas zeae]|uniref:hypothetical protein n=1 Tax=Filimonas zeae TaxID=1737353 RepID=UPI00166781D5|nr:hypothetical protein [Filimonas zeae]MDR6337493.1 hypothetical protein [Filimonas zeae]